MDDITIKEEYQVTEFQALEQAILQQYKGGSLATPFPPLSKRLSIEEEGSDNSDGALLTENSDNELKKSQDGQRTSSLEQECPVMRKRKCLNNDSCGNKQKRERPPESDVENASTIKVGHEQIQRRYPAKRPSILQNANDEQQLKHFLQSIKMECIFGYLKAAQVTYKSLQYLQREDLKEAIPPLGLRAEFREKLFAWKKSGLEADETVIAGSSKVEEWLKQNEISAMTPSASCSSAQVLSKNRIDDETLSDTIASKVISLLQNQLNFASTSTPTASLSAPTGGCKLSKTLKLVLQDTAKGKAIIDYYEKNGYLIDSFRADLINLILDDIFFHKVYLSAKDFPLIVEEILVNFPNEIKEYYFIPRNIKKNPGGKLWDKYTNQKAKRARTSVNLKDNLESTASITPSVADTEIDDSILIPLKVSLSKDFSDWEAVKDKWQRTFLLRQKELKTSITNYEFLRNWPLYSNARSHELINIDFELLYPKKSALLLTKWNEFLKNIKRYCLSHVKDKNSKDILINSKDITNQNSLDYIYTILLNSVIIPTARFTNKSTKQLKKISIPDANESFIVHLTTIHNYEKVILELREKYYNVEWTVQPLVIVVGESVYNLEHFYVYFNNTLLKFDSFLNSLDLCFKIMQTLSLEYPKGCTGPWLFIQEYFYEISVPHERKVSNVCSLLNYLRTQHQNL